MLCVNAGGKKARDHLIQLVPLSRKLTGPVVPPLSEIAAILDETRLALEEEIVSA